MHYATGFYSRLYIQTVYLSYIAEKRLKTIFYIVLQWLENKSKTAVILGDCTLLKETYMDTLVELKNGIPVQYITNQAPFYSLNLYVDESVLIPRPETEQLVHLVISENSNFSGSIIDIGTGSGCVALALKNKFPKARVTGCDISPEALRVANKNAHTLDLDVSFATKDILSEKIDQVDIIVSNPPYIASSEKGKMHINVLDNEPHLALFVEGNDPLLFYKRIIQLAEGSKNYVLFRD